MGRYYSLSLTPPLSLARNLKKQELNNDSPRPGTLEHPALSTNRLRGLKVPVTFHSTLYLLTKYSSLRSALHREEKQHLLHNLYFHF